MTQHKKTFLHIENSFEYDLDKNVKQHYDEFLNNPQSF